MAQDAGDESAWPGRRYSTREPFCTACIGGQDAGALKATNGKCSFPKLSTDKPSKPGWFREIFASMNWVVTRAAVSMGVAAQLAVASAANMDEARIQFFIYRLLSFMNRMVFSFE